MRLHKVHHGIKPSPTCFASLYIQATGKADNAYAVRRKENKEPVSAWHLATRMRFNKAVQHSKLLAQAQAC